MKIVVRMFANHLIGRGSIPGRVIPKTQMILDATLLYKVCIKGKVSNPGKGVAPLPYNSVY